MIFPRLCVVVCVVLLSVVVSPAQEAQAILDGASKVYTNAQSYSAEIESRSLTLVVGANDGEGKEPRFEVRGTNLRRIKIKVRRPNEYWVGVQGRQQRMTMSDMPSSQSASPWSFWARTSETQAKQGVYTGMGGKFLVRDIPVEQFQQLSRSQLSSSHGLEDVVLRHFPTQGAVADGNLSLGLLEPDLIGRETRNGKAVYRLAAKTANGDPVMLWIEADTSLVVRTVVQQSSRSRFATLVETLYNNQQTKAVFLSSDFAIVAPPSNEPPSESGMGFGSASELVKVMDLKPTGQAGAGGSEGIAEQPAVPTPPVAPATPAAPVGEQALSYEQMSGIVLIEGDGGTATGFMTKIRDVDFVVTNLHVLGGNKKMTLKTLRGEEIPMLGVFGAAGSDIAIIRIGKGQGDLKLAADVFKTAKIGDKVVVVGNRQGGGVATQTAGSILGVGPNRIEVNANFEPGNSGSPIVNLGTGEVVGVASYSETRQINVEEHGGQPAGRTRSRPAPAAVEKRWFGYRLDSVSKWEAIDPAKWSAQAERIEKFNEMSDALVAILRLDFNTARQHPRLGSLITSFETRMRSTSGTGVSAATEVKDLFRVIRTISEDGVTDLKNGDYYDYYRTCLYWESSIPAQLEYRKAIVEVLKKYEANSAGYLSRMRGGS